MDIIFDMDGTLMNIEHRRHHVSGDKKDWQAFKNATVADTPYDMICDLAVTTFYLFETLLCVDLAKMCLPNHLI